MELARVSSKGQITIPISVRKKLNLNAGDGVAFSEKDGLFYFGNPAYVAFKRLEEDFAGAAAEAGFKNEEEMQKYMLGIRKEVRGY